MPLPGALATLNLNSFPYGLNGISFVPLTKGRFGRTRTSCTGPEVAGTLLVTIDRTTTLLDTAPEPSGPRAPSRWLHPAPTTTASAAITHIQLIRVISAIRG